MGKKINVWLDSGANIHSKFEQVIDLADRSITDEEWDNMDDVEREGLMQEIAFETLEWGWEDEDSEIES